MWALFTQSHFLPSLLFLLSGRLINVDPSFLPFVVVIGDRSTIDQGEKGRRRRRRGLVNLGQKGSKSQRNEWGQTGHNDRRNLCPRFANHKKSDSFLFFQSSIPSNDLAFFLLILTLVCETLLLVLREKSF